MSCGRPSRSRACRGSTGAKAVQSMTCGIWGIGHAPKSALVSTRSRIHAFAATMCIGARPVAPLALPGAAVEVEPVLVRWPVGLGVAGAPAGVGGVGAVVLGPGERPHVHERPHDGLGDPADLPDGEESVGDPVQVDDVGGRGVDGAGAQRSEHGRGSPGIVCQPVQPPGGPVQLACWQRGSGAGLPGEPSGRPVRAADEGANSIPLSTIARSGRRRRGPRRRRVVRAEVEDARRHTWLTLGVWSLGSPQVSGSGLRSSVCVVGLATSAGRICLKVVVGLNARARGVRVERGPGVVTDTLVVGVGTGRAFEHEPDNPGTLLALLHLLRSDAWIVEEARGTGISGHA